MSTCVDHSNWNLLETRPWGKIAWETLNLSWVKLPVMTVGSLAALWLLIQRRMYNLGINWWSHVQSTITTQHRSGKFENEWARRRIRLNVDTQNPGLPTFQAFKSILWTLPKRKVVHFVHAKFMCIQRHSGLEKEIFSSLNLYHFARHVALAEEQVRQAKTGVARFIHTKIIGYKAFRNGSWAWYGNDDWDDVHVKWFWRLINVSGISLIVLGWKWWKDGRESERVVKVW